MEESFSSILLAQRALIYKVYEENHLESLYNIKCFCFFNHNKPIFLTWFPQMATLNSHVTIRLQEYLLLSVSNELS